MHNITHRHPLELTSVYMCIRTRGRVFNYLFKKRASSECPSPVSTLNKGWSKLIWTTYIPSIISLENERKRNTIIEEFKQVYCINQSGMFSQHQTTFRKLLKKRHAKKVKMRDKFSGTEKKKNVVDVERRGKKF